MLQNENTRISKKIKAKKPTKILPITMSEKQNKTKRNLKDINPLLPIAPFLYPLKTSENRQVFWSFQGVEKEYIGNKWIKISEAEKLMFSLFNQKSWDIFWIYIFLIPSYFNSYYFLKLPPIFDICWKVYFKAYITKVTSERSKFKKEKRNQSGQGLRNLSNMR